MALKLSTGHVVEMGKHLDTIYTKGFIRVFGSPRPASSNDAETGTMLFQVTLGSATYTEATGVNGLNFATPTTNVVIKEPAETWSGLGVAAGQAVWARFYPCPTFVSGTTYADVTGAKTTVPRFDMSVGTSGSGADLIMAGSTTVAVGAPQVVQSFSYTFPTGE